jgi:hypothetical protein
MGGNFIVVPDKVHPPFRIPARSITLNDEEMNEIASGAKQLWVWGFLSAQDFLGAIRDTGFVAHWEPIGVQGESPRGFVIEGPPKYNYDRERKADEPTTGPPPHLGGGSVSVLQGELAT